MYIDGFYNNKSDTVSIVERVNGKRVFKEYPADYHYFISDPTGTYRTLFGDRVKRIDPATPQERTRLTTNTTSKLWEANINPVLRCLEAEYKEATIPDAQISYFDIETDFHPVKGYSSPDDAFNPITSIAIYNTWEKRMYCLAVPPPTLTFEEAVVIGEEIGDEVEMFKTERAMLDRFLEVIEDSDIISGWNSRGFDIPVIVNRMKQVMDKSALTRLCLWNKTPKPTVFESNGQKIKSYDFIGRVCIDYMILYKQYNVEQKTSYALNAIAEEELNETKIDYPGTLDSLYKNDFKLFLEYNIQDTMLLSRLDDKKDYMSMTKAMAIACKVLLPHVGGTIAKGDQAITIKAHSMGLVVPDAKVARKVTLPGGYVAETKPELKGLHYNIFSTDLNSLYPSTERAWNMSPETIIAQLDVSETYIAIEAHLRESKKHSIGTYWNNKFSTIEYSRYADNDNTKPMRLRFMDGETIEVTGHDLRALIESNEHAWAISPYGTIFRVDKPGLIPTILSEQYNERVLLKKQMKIYISAIFNDKHAHPLVIPANMFGPEDIDDSIPAIDGSKLENGFKPAKLNELVDSGDRKAVVYYLNQHRMHVKNGQVCGQVDADVKELVRKYSVAEQIIKLLINSYYGLLGNNKTRFTSFLDTYYESEYGALGSHCFDEDGKFLVDYESDHSLFRGGPSIAASTTLGGRNITRHMSATANAIITGLGDGGTAEAKYEYDGETILAVDTDSNYLYIPKHIFDSSTMTPEQLIEFADVINDKINATFPSFLYDQFRVPESWSTGVIEAGREIVASGAIFFARKRYCAMIIDDEGDRKDIDGAPGKLKVIGLDLKRSDTNAYMKPFLKEVLVGILTGKTEQQTLDSITEFKNMFDDLPPWERGFPKGANKVEHYRDVLYAATHSKVVGKKKIPTIPGHIRAALAYNDLLDFHDEKHLTRIGSGAKIMVVPLIESVENKYARVAIPSDLIETPDKIPSWFKELPFDTELMMETAVDKKLSNILTILDGYDISRTGKKAEIFNSLFSF